MRIGFQLVIFLIILNLVSGLMYTLGVPGTAYSNILPGTGSVEEYAERFNATEFMEGTQPEVSSLLTYTGHIWSGLQLLWNGIRFVLLGFPTMLQQIGAQIPDPTASAAFTNISYVLYAVFSLVIFFWLFQLLTGREVED